MALIDELRREVKRVASRETRSQLQSTRKLVASHRRHIADLRRQVTALEKELAQVAKVARSAHAAAPTEEALPATKARFNGGAWRVYRQRAGVSAESIGALLGVSAQSIYNYETGSTSPRPKQAALLAELKIIGVRALRKRIAEASF